MRRSALAALVTTLALALCAAPAAAVPFTVTSTADAVDANPGDASCASASNGCTLRAAVQEANMLAGPDEIDLPAGTYRLTLAGTGEDAAATGDLDVTSDPTLVGSAARAVTITAHQENSNSAGIDRVLDVITGGALALSKVTLDGGQAAN